MIVLNHARTLGWTAAAVLLGLQSSPSWAQRAGDNALTAAQDAFGTTVGNESIGLYSTTNARGFSPVTAGNVRVEGLYFDRKGEFSNRLVSGAAVRVGISAQSYPFVAPVGVADYRLRVPGDETVVSVVSQFGPYASFTTEVDTEIPVSDKFSVGLGAGGGYTDAVNSGGAYTTWSAAAIARWKITEGIEFIPFWSREEEYDRETTPRIFATGSLPPRISRRVFYGQDWALFVPRTSNLGGLARGQWGGWSVRVGLFRSVRNEFENTITMARNIQPDGTAARSFLSFPPVRLASTSGEVRVSRVLTEGDRQHTFYVATRGRISNRLAGGSVTLPAGSMVLAVPDPQPEPTFNYLGRLTDRVREGNLGASYALTWRNVGDLSLGVQRSFYKRTVAEFALSATSKSKPWLYTATATGRITDDLAIYGSYNRGLEDGGTAPTNAVNPSAGAPATITKQIDAGVRYAITPSLKVVAGVFTITKPRYDLDLANVFRQVGTIKHEGFEFSVSGQPIEGLTVVGGVILLRARLSGILVDSGLIGRVSPGTFPLTTLLNLQYGPASWKGFSVDSQLLHNDPVYTDTSNTFKVPGTTTLALGGRYRFKLLDSPATLRAQVLNVTNSYKWTLFAGRSFLPLEPRRFTLQLAVDF